MTRSPSFAFAAVFAAALAAGCADLEKEKLPQVTTTGPHSVEVGATIMIAASTINGADKTYAFSSGTAGVATVDAAGVVTGVAPGEAAITVTGADSKAVAVHAVVVIDKRAASADGGAPERPQVPASEVPYYQAWLTSAHADPTAVAFNNWNKDGAVPTTCARCHSSEGFVDYLGGDGSVPGAVDKPAPTQSLVRCATCHAAAAQQLTSVTFPSGAKVEGLGHEAICMTCHQGRASGADVDKNITASGVTDADQTSPMLSFTNIHYYPAAATLFAGRAKGGYQYAGKVYDTRFRHVDGFNTCTGCHDPHTARPRVDACATCHAGVKTVADLRNVRMFSSAGRDYDGDGDVSEGIYHELAGLREKVLAAIVRYGVEKHTPLCYGESAYPYWFVDGNADGACSAAEVTSTNGFKSWTPRLTRAAFNYQMSSKDPGAFAHNAKYIMELLYDSLQDVNAALVVKIDTSRMVRGDQGHFDGASEAARHWDAGEKVDATCSRCHGGQPGYRFFVEHGVSIDVPETANGLECGTCHTSFGPTWDVLAVKSTSFPGGTTGALAGNDNLCSTCHAGRVGKADIDAAIAAGKPAFLNVHYLAAGAVREGAAAKVGYEYEGKSYAGPLKHTGGMQCTSCHDPIATRHSFRIADAWEARCRTCHADANGEVQSVRQAHLADYDGDGNTRESLAAEIAGLGERVLAAMASAAGAGGLCYSETTYPYFFKDADGDHKPMCAAAEATTAGRFTAWNAKLMKAAHNYQLSHKDPGSWAHNFDYVGQLLYDSVEDLGGPVTALRRP
jgi:predicted CXXCH cytochrome family protein